MRFALGMLLLPLLPSCSPDAPGTPEGGATPRADDACTVAVRFVDSWLDQRRGTRAIVFSDAPDTTPVNPAPGPWFKPTGEYGDAPARALLDKGQEMPRDSAVARCPTLRAYLDGAHIRYGAAAVAQTANAPDGQSLYPADILGVTLPTLGADGTEALTMTSFRSGPQSGQGRFFLLKRQRDGTWPAISLQTLSID